MEFGKPIEVSDEILELYYKDRRNAYSELLKVVEQRLKSVCYDLSSLSYCCSLISSVKVTLLAPDLQTLHAILIGRRIYQPDNVEYAILQISIFVNLLC